MGKIDDNNNYVLMGEDPDGNPKAISIDNTTGYVNVVATDTANTPSTQNATVDKNNRYVTLVEMPDGTVIPLLTDESGNVYINYTEE